jgi:hypothetical protein
VRGKQSQARIQGTHLCERIHVHRRLLAISHIPVNSERRDTHHLAMYTDHIGHLYQKSEIASVDKARTHRRATHYCVESTIDSALEVHGSLADETGPRASGDEKRSSS